MNKTLIAALLAGATLSASADLTTVSFADKVTHPTAKARKIKHVKSAEMTKQISPMVRANSRNEALPEGVVMIQTFEDWDGENKTWTPDGWTVESKVETDRAESWTPEKAQYGLPSPTSGTKFYGVSYSTYAKDEWLISPEFNVEDGMLAAYSVFYSPMYLFSSENLDADTGEYNGDKIIAATYQIWIQPEGGEWEMIFDITDEFKHMNYEQLCDATGFMFEARQHDISKYAGKKAKLGFRYVGTDGNTIFVDDIWVGYPHLQGVSYFEPYSTLYWGFNPNWMMTAIAPVAQHPVYAPLTWGNYSDCYGEADFTWEYEDPESTGNNFLTSTNQDELTITLKPRYATEALKRNNFFTPPVIKASADKHQSASFSGNYVYMQGGGTSELTDASNNSVKVSLLQFNPFDLGVTYTTVEDTEEGIKGIPVFGYDALGTPDNYWLKYQLNGNEAAPTDYNHLIGIANLFMPTEAPLVVNGLTLHAWGELDPEAELTATIYALDADMTNDPSTFTKFAQATCKGSDISSEYSDDNGYMLLTFNFDEPAIVKYTEDHPAYFFMIEGFRSDKVKYFAPLQSEIPDVFCWAYIMSESDMSAHLGGPQGAVTYLKPITYKEDITDPESYVDPMGAFAIGINGEYPWLTCETESIEITDEAPEAKVALGSYYDGSKLTVDAPEGLIATVSGRYDEGTLTVSRKPGTPAITGGVITVSGPGVKVSIKTTTEEAGIHEITSAANGAEKIFDLQGRRVVNATKGNIYIVNGSKTIL